MIRYNKMKGEINMTMNQAIFEDYQAHLTQNHSKRSVDAYCRDIKRFMEQLKGSIKDTTQADVEDYLNHLKAEVKPNGEPKLKPASIRRCYSSLNNFFTYLVEAGELEANPIADMDSPKQSRVSEAIDYITPEEVDQLIEMAYELNQDKFVKLREALAIQLTAETGIRMGEMLAMTISQLNVEQQQATIVSKEGLVRQVPMSDALTKLVQSYLTERQKIQCPKNNRHLVFVTTRGGKYTTQLCHGSLTRYAEATGIKRVSNSLLRHTCAYQLIQQGKTMEEMAKLLGHASPHTIKENYGKWMNM